MGESPANLCGENIYSAQRLASTQTGVGFISKEKKNKTWIFPRRLEFELKEYHSYINKLQFYKNQVAIM